MVSPRQLFTPILRHSQFGMDPDNPTTWYTLVEFSNRTLLRCLQDWQWNPRCRFCYSHYYNLTYQDGTIDEAYTANTPVYVDCGDPAVEETLHFTKTVIVWQGSPSTPRENVVLAQVTTYVGTFPAGTENPCSWPVAHWPAVHEWAISEVCEYDPIPE